jgi:serine protease AprX
MTADRFFFRRNAGGFKRATLAALAIAATIFTLPTGRTSAQGGSRQPHRAHLSDDLLAHLGELRVRPKSGGDAGSPVRLIVHGSREVVAAAAERHGLNVLQWLEDGAVVAADGSELQELAADPAIDHLSGDVPVRPLMAVSVKAVAADQTWAGTSGLLGIGAIAGVTGTGVGVAVIDSGINTSHSALKNKVAANVSFVTGDPSTADAYGHGTHVAGIIAGLGSASVTTLYKGGVAPGAHLVNVRVLGKNGAGYTSDVIRGIDWVIEKRSTYNIRVINLSLGHPVMESSTTDPLCLAVKRAVAAGIVVVAAAGNDGQTDTGVPILGGITSPGNSPYAITVGAVDTHGTVSRGDDTIAPYSSRGPTKYDFAVKPDLAAPGSRIVSTEAYNSYLSVTYPLLHKAGSGNNAYMQLTGTSMAAPVVSGAVALLLQGTPGLGTGQVKLALQSGASYMADPGLIGAGTGSLNIWASRKIAAQGLSSLLTSITNILIGGLSANGSGASFWDAGTMAHRIWTREGIRLLGLLDLSKIWSNVSLLLWGDLNLVGLLNPLATMPSNDLIWGTNDEIIWGTNDQDEIIWGTTGYDQNGDEIIWGTSGDDEIIWGTGTPDTLTEP